MTLEQITTLSLLGAIFFAGGLCPFPAIGNRVAIYFHAQQLEDRGLGFLIVPLIIAVSFMLIFSIIFVINLQ